MGARAARRRGAVHVHFAVGRFVHHSWSRGAWGHGYVHIKLLSDLPVESGSLGETRLAARYLAKYVGKGLGASGFALHRYDVAQGFQPRAERIAAESLPEALAAPAEAMGGEPEHVWDSRADAD